MTELEVARQAAPLLARLLARIGSDAAVVDAAIPHAESALQVGAGGGVDVPGGRPAPISPPRVGRQHTPK